MKNLQINNKLFIKLATLISLFIGASILSFPTFAKNSQTLQSPIGIWKTIDDVTGKPRSLVQISEQNGKLIGKVIKIYYRKGESDADVCEKCPGERRNKPFINMVILWDMEQKHNIWTNGSILDPETGKIYKCNIKLVDHGKKLDVHGYIGISLIGRSQTWLREN